MLNGKRRNALSVPVGGGGSPSGTLNAFSSVLKRGQSGPLPGCPISLDQYTPTYTQNAHRKQRPVTWRGQGQAQSPTCSIRRSTCRSSSVQNRWPTSPDDSRQRCCGATSKCWNPLAFPAIQFRHITGAVRGPHPKESLLHQTSIPDRTSGASEGAPPGPRARPSRSPAPRRAGSPSVG